MLLLLLFAVVHHLLDRVSSGSGSGGIGGRWEKSGWCWRKLATSRGESQRLTGERVVGWVGQLKRWMVV